jgi:hypothetical protein
MDKKKPLELTNGFLTFNYYIIVYLLYGESMMKTYIDSAIDHCQCQFAKLFLLIVASASAFHFTKSQSSAVKAAGHGAQPILNSFMNSKKESSQFMTEQEINIEKLRNELKNKSVEHNNTSSPVASNVKPPIIQSQVNIKASENVKDILSRIHNIQPNKINNNTETQDESATNDRLVSESSLSDSSKKKARTKKKSNISIV